MKTFSQGVSSRMVAWYLARRTHWRIACFVDGMLSISLRFCVNKVCLALFLEVSLSYIRITKLSIVGRISRMFAAAGVWASVRRAGVPSSNFLHTDHAIRSCSSSCKTSRSCRTRWVHEKQVIHRTCKCPTFMPCELYQGTGMFFTIQMTQWAVHMSVCWRYRQCQKFLHVLVFSCILAWHRRQRLAIASEKRSSFPRVISTTPVRKVFVVTLSLRRFQSSRRNWCQFQAVTVYGFLPCQDAILIKAKYSLVSYHWLELCVVLLGC